MMRFLKLMLAAMALTIFQLNCACAAVEPQILDCFRQSRTVKALWPGRKFEHWDWRFRLKVGREAHRLLPAAADPPARPRLMSAGPELILTVYRTNRLDIVPAGEP